MLISLHKQAMTTPKVRAAIQASAIALIHSRPCFSPVGQGYSMGPVTMPTSRR